MRCWELHGHVINRLNITYEIFQGELQSRIPNGAFVIHISSSDQLMNFFLPLSHKKKRFYTKKKILVLSLNSWNCPALPDFYCNLVQLKKYRLLFCEKKGTPFQKFVYLLTNYKKLIVHIAHSDNFHPNASFINVCQKYLFLDF